MPDPRIPTKIIETMHPATIQAELRPSSAGSADHLLPRVNGVSQRSPEAPPKDAAAAEIAMRTGPTGLNNPERQKSRPPATYAGTLSSLLLRMERSSLPTSVPNHCPDRRASSK